MGTIISCPKCRRTGPGDDSGTCGYCMAQAAQKRAAKERQAEELVEDSLDAETKSPCWLDFPSHADPELDLQLAIRRALAVGFDREQVYKLMRGVELHSDDELRDRLTVSTLHGATMTQMGLVQRRERQRTYAKMWVYQTLTWALSGALLVLVVIELVRRGQA